jgi:hypothetical protein
MEIRRIHNRHNSSRKLRLEPAAQKRSCAFVYRTQVQIRKPPITQLGCANHDVGYLCPAAQTRHAYIAVSIESYAVVRDDIQSTLGLARPGERFLSEGIFPRYSAQEMVRGLATILR